MAVLPAQPNADSPADWDTLLGLSLWRAVEWCPVFASAQFVSVRKANKTVQLEQYL